MMAPKVIPYTCCEICGQTFFLSLINSSEESLPLNDPMKLGYFTSAKLIFGKDTSNEIFGGVLLLLWYLNYHKKMNNFEGTSDQR